MKIFMPINAFLMHFIYFCCSQNSNEMKKKTARIKKLTLAKEFITRLENRKQHNVVGGGTASGDTCCTVDGTVVYTQYGCTNTCPSVTCPPVKTIIN